MSLLLNRRRNIQQQIKRENAYLKELTRSLDEMNRKQEELQHNQRLQLIGTLTGGIAHEFRNLLTPIMGYSGLLRETLPPDSPMRADIDEIYTSAVRAKEIIKQITSLSRKNLDPVFKPLPLDDILPRILKVVATMKPAGAEMHVDVDFDGHRIMGNATQINQVILNLCNNAFQALPDDGGALWVSGRIEEDEGARFAVLRFRDNGAGMDAKVRDRIFDPFFTTKRVGEGTGLGLSVVQNIVDLHQGAIEVDSEPGRGTTFTLRFPTVRPNEIDGELEEPEARPLREPLDIVLVEDDSHVLRVFQRGLEQNGFTVKAFTEPLEALRELEQNSCDLLVTDYNMPRMTGAELAMRARGLAKKPKILVLTGFADKEMLEFLRQDIIDGYQIKPVEISELVEKINTLFA